MTEKIYFIINQNKCEIKIGSVWMTVHQVGIPFLLKLIDTLAAGDGKKDTFKYKLSKCEKCDYIIDWQYHDLEYKCCCGFFNHRKIKHYDSKLVVLMSDTAYNNDPFNCEIKDYIEAFGQQCFDGTSPEWKDFWNSDECRQIYEYAKNKNIRILSLEEFNKEKEVDI